ncbi:uncharacterized protein mocs2 isoform X2 [Cynoglossus semilaevis]|uniref:uncharacterized protein mocs2 isoform X2 n=1 Tax=Cynoglossus semilaevis TaxID=244447 RepID=UPI000D62EEBE|nr:uncharacterized protein LOC103397249 isoform X2 [Cynoglossus semilaevis]
MSLFQSNESACVCLKTKRRCRRRNICYSSCRRRLAVKTHVLSPKLIGFLLAPETARVYVLCFAKKCRTDWFERGKGSCCSNTSQQLGPLEPVAAATPKTADSAGQGGVGSASAVRGQWRPGGSDARRRGKTLLMRLPQGISQREDGETGAHGGVHHSLAEVHGSEGKDSL